MNKLKALSRIVLTALIIASIGTPLCQAAVRGGSQTRILRLSYWVHGNRTCLTFDAVGPRPKRIGPASDIGISVFFSKMAVGFSHRDFSGAKIAVKEVKFWRGSSFFEVLFRWKNTSVTYYVRPEWHGRYALTLILTAPALKVPVTGAPDESPSTDFIANAGAKAPPVKIKRIKTSQLFGSTVSAQERAAFANALKSAKAGEPSQAGQTNPGATPFVEPDQKGLALYARANEKFEGCSRRLIFCASDIIQAYKVALQAGPKSSQAPLALYRSGLAYYIMGRYRRADNFFKTVTSRWPDNPVACRCWIGIGDICMKTEAYIAAMEAYRWAVMDATGKKDKAAADYALGKNYLILGADKQALDTLQDCLAREPDYYVKHPRVLRSIGDADFALRDFDNAKQMLLRYVNYQEGDPDQGMVLAKLAEIFLQEGQVEAAKKMYGFVHKYYTNSEGDIICQIRAAELMEKVNLGKAIAMYNGLRNKELSPSLRSIVLMKLAELELKKCDLEHSLALMEKAFPIQDEGTLPPGIAALRERVFCHLVTQFYSNKNFDKVVQLVDKYRGLFNSIDSPATLEEIAQSYAALKSYLNALKIYDRLLAQQHGQDLDGILLRCAVYALRLKDYHRALHYAQQAQSGVLEWKKSEIFGQIYYLKEQYSEAIGCFGKVLHQRNQFYISDPDSYAAYGYSLYQMRNYGQAIPILKTALLRATAHKNARQSILVTLSDCFKEQKQYGQAVAMMQTAIRIAGGEEKDQLLYRLSKLYLAAGKSALAVQSLNRMRATNDTFWSSVAQQELNTINMEAQAGGNAQ